MPTELSSGRSLRYAAVVLAIAALLFAGLLSSHPGADHKLDSFSGTPTPTTNEGTSNFVASGGLVPDEGPAEPSTAASFGIPR
jgi:hypothetical protein